MLLRMRQTIYSPIICGGGGLCSTEEREMKARDMEGQTDGERAREGNRMGRTCMALRTSDDSLQLELDWRAGRIGCSSRADVAYRAAIAQR